MNSKNNKNIGLINGKFKSCPKSPNCVSTQSPKKGNHFMKPLEYIVSKDKSKNRLIEIIKSHNRAEIVKETENYIHAIFTIFLFRWKDDVEFFFDDEKRLVHFKSQSRVGYWDFGVNKLRMKWIKKKFQEK